ncbi:phosphohistidine phosphatase SixA [Litoribrevibacter albus]|uniref:Phosphohistidine phosphatase SixA n=1 Tax=Litoribrevibacter albus TaxID=1473156 RepID=A0AA37SAW6_9GAMM|nr:phosphohistidine phosphatase SixA [Litoribrevibacter albus]GLQ31914.1 phosphohistidine phosphatase SixA [Litoribrevibacter albus]
MRIAIVRHGEASYGADSDAQRQLTDYGRKQAKSTGTQLKDWCTEHTKLLHSPFERTSETASIISQELGIDAIPLPVLQAGTPFQKIIEWLQNTTETDVILVSHNPMVTEITNALVYGVEAVSQPRLVFDTGYACCLECEYPGTGCVELIKRIIP